MKKSTLLALLLFFLCIIKGYSQSKFEADSILQICNRLIDPNGPAVSVLLTQSDKSIFKKSFGLRNIERKTASDIHSQFTIGSISKIFASLSILMLEEKGMLKLDDPVNLYFPQMTGWNKITIRHLLNHTSGLNDSLLLDRLMKRSGYHYFSPDSNFHNDPSKDFTLLLYIWWRAGEFFYERSEFLDFDPEMYSSFEPGSKYKYSNAGFYMLARIVEVVSKLPYDEFLRKNIFIPLGMKNTFSLTKNNPPLIKNIATNYMHNTVNRRIEIPPFIRGGMGAADVVTSIHDWEKFVRSFRKSLSPLIKKESFDAATSFQTTYATREKHNFGYGYGFQVAYFKEDSLFRKGHTGGTIGSSASFFYYPQKDISFTVLTASQPDSPNEFGTWLDVIIAIQDYLKRCNMTIM